MSESSISRKLRFQERWYTDMFRMTTWSVIFILCAFICVKLVCIHTYRIKHWYLHHQMCLITLNQHPHIWNISFTGLILKLTVFVLVVVLFMSGCLIVHSLLVSVTQQGFMVTYWKLCVHKLFKCDLPGESVNQNLSGSRVTEMDLNWRDKNWNLSTTMANRNLWESLFLGLNFLGCHTAY